MRTTVKELERIHKLKKRDELQSLLLSTSLAVGLDDIAAKLKVGRDVVVELIEMLAAEGINVSITSRGVELSREFLPTHAVVNSEKISGRKIRFGATADNHLSSKYARLDVLNALFDTWEAEGIDTVFQMGNIIDGESRFNRHDLVAHGVEGQIDHLLENWPQRKGITTKFLTGDDHEGWYIQREGINIGQYIEEKARRGGRTDVEFIGHMEHNITYRAKGGESVMRVIHGGGGTAYAISYTDQKYAESLQGGEKPAIVLVGHYHKFNYGYPREIHAVQVGCTQDQTPFMRKKRIQAMVGGCTIEFTQDDSGVIRGFNTRWMPFYDRSFYTGKLWGYRFG